MSSALTHATSRQPVSMHSPVTVIGEWRSGSHYNLGQGPEATSAAFLARVTEIFGGRDQLCHMLR